MSAPQDPPDAGMHPPADPGSFAARLKQRHGEGIDPEVSLDAAPGSPALSDAGATSELVRRLASHAPGSSRYVLEGELAPRPVPAQAGGSGPRFPRRGAFTAPWPNPSGEPPSSAVRARSRP